MQTIDYEEMLAAYASGTTSPGLSLLCAAHLTLAPSARSFVDMAEEVGGSLLEEEATSAVDPMDFERLLARLDVADQEDAIAKCGRSSDIPAPILRALDHDYDETPWRFRLPGIHEHVIESFAPERVSLLKAKPGRKVPQHTHAGDEATLVLTGALEDGGKVYRAGDVSLAGPDHDHTPTIIGEETCVCLVVTNGALRFTGTFGRALNLFGE